MEENNAKPRVVNVGIQTFYEALLSQGVECAQIQWHPPVKQSEEIESLLDKFL
ncbi:MAG: fdrA domain protein [Candidatus Limiplasma sp.]|nr:fdrA domain protein [Candidatus Limiplasma sp.]